MIRTDIENIYIPLNRKEYGVITEGCELNAIEYHNNELCISHQQYNVRFQHDVRDGESYDWIFISPREDNLNADEILDLIRSRELQHTDEPKETKLTLVEQLKANEDKMKGDLQDSQILGMKDFLAKNDDF